jgi:aerobic carbon-monoxide dehydrogenase large subunit
MTSATSAQSHRTIRVEDEPLVRGLGRFVDDVEKQGAAYAVFVRSPHAHARIVSIDASAALAAPGVLAALTAADMDKAGAGNVARPVPFKDRHGKPAIISQRDPLAREKVRHVGEPVAVVVAQTPLQALDAAELVAVEYEELPAVIDAAEAMIFSTSRALAPSSTIMPGQSMARLPGTLSKICGASGCTADF